MISESTFSIHTTLCPSCTIGFVEKELVTNLLKECGTMHLLEHPNVLKLRGVCLDGGPAPYVVMPFMANGSLLSYLRDHQEALVMESSADNNTVNTA